MAAGEMLGCKYETQKDHFSFLPHRTFTDFPADRREENCKTGLRPRIAVGAEIAKAADFTHWPVQCATPLATALQQPRSSRFGETPAFTYTYCTNQLLNGFMRRLLGLLGLGTTSASRIQPAFS